MLTLPEASEPFRLIGIDPGTASLGISQLHWWGPTQPITVLDAWSLKVADVPSNLEGLHMTHGHRMARMTWLQSKLSQTFDHCRPHAVIAESPYLGRFPASFAALTELFMLLRQAMFAYDPTLPLYDVDPISAKKAAGVVLRSRKKGDQHSKDDVRRALATHARLDWAIDLHLLDEHSVDAIAVALYYLEEVI